MTLTTVIAINAILDLAVLFALGAVMAIPFRIERPRSLLRALAPSQPTADRLAA